MKPEEIRKFSQGLISRDKWSESLGRFVDVLRINIFVIDSTGRIIIPPVIDRNNRGRYGAGLLNMAFGFDFGSMSSRILDKFKQHGPYMETRGLFDLYAFAVPVKLEEGQTIAYMIVGPVILNRRWDSDVYLQLAKDNGVNSDNLTDLLHELRVVSFVTIKAVLDLLAQIAKDIVELSLQNKRLHLKRFNKDILPEGVLTTAEDIYADIHMDELLVMVLDVALKCTGAECGSIMLMDKQSRELNIKVARGIEKERLAQARAVPIGEGIAGLAAQENRFLVIDGLQGENRIQPYLKRPDIKHSAVVPLMVQNRVFGVLNMHTKMENARLEFDEKNLQHLSLLISTALHNI